MKRYSALVLGFALLVPTMFVGCGEEAKEAAVDAKASATDAKDAAVEAKDAAVEAKDAAVEAVK